MGGISSYPANTDYRVWLEVIRRFRDLNFRAKDEASAQRTLDAMRDIQVMVFGGVLEGVNPVKAMMAIAKFAKGYPSAPMQEKIESEKTMSYEYDLNEILIAIRVQYGIDLSYRCEYFHWWEFLLLVHCLAGDHYILNLMQIRGYKGKDKEMLKEKYRCALPEELNEEEQAEMDEFMAMFEEGE